MEKEIRELVQAFHDTPGRIVFVTAGAGSKALSWLQGVAGASRTLLEALVPYQQPAFNDFLGFKPDQYVSPETAGRLAGTAFQRAIFLGDRMPEGEQRPVIGLICTATIATDRPKRGEHRAHIVYWRHNKVARHSIYLEKGSRGREAEEKVVSRIILNALSEGYGLNDKASVQLLDGDLFETDSMDIKAKVNELLAGQADCFGLAPDGTAVKQIPKGILSGSFDPLHQGHKMLAKAAEKILNTPVAFELSVINADKPALPLPDILNRLSQFAGRHTILAGSAPTFVQKAYLYPNSTFIVGYDTAERILQTRFYNDSLKERDKALETIRQQGCCFLVAGRSDQTGTFHDAASLDTPPAFTDLFQPIAADAFRRDISSTEIRQQNSESAE